ncbi:hypothetical protein [Sphingobium sp. WCS2017Hpa-17]|uniref:hypothetical protein n=1 Tax=Sphingobium sp. WCS2017Hpa-17 TaxID=3073638 RepID=UPI00288C0CC8|nr:hypothetical protein [Sphingobium sp. WCS2017Hpa-17]
MEIGNLDKPVDLAPGEWVEEIPALPGVRLLVRSTNFKPYETAIQGLARRTGKKLSTDEGMAKFGIATGKVLAEHILLDWDLSKAEDIAVLTTKGKPLPFSKENALLVLTAADEHGVGKAYRNGVEWAGDQVADKVRERAKEAAGN